MADNQRQPTLSSRDGGGTGGDWKKPHRQRQGQSSNYPLDSYCANTQRPTAHRDGLDHHAKKDEVDDGNKKISRAISLAKVLIAATTA